MLSSTRGQVSFITAGMAIAAVVVSLLATPRPAAAVVPRESTNVTAPAAAIAGTHRCQNFGGTYRGYRAGHCADVYLSSSEFFPVTGQAQSFCQIASTGVIVRCVGIEQIVRIKDVWAPRGNFSDLFRCGSATTPPNTPACPAGRFQNLSTDNDPLYCGHEYVTIMRTTVVLPVSLQRVSSGEWTSNVWHVTC